jgi:2-methylcitrate dehydratase
MIRYLDWNDGYISKGSGHPSDSIPALIAAAETAHASGQDLIVATVIAYEVFCRVMDVWANKPVGVAHETVGAMASVAGVGRLMRLTEEQLTHAISITVASNITLNQTRAEHVSNWKACGYANVNRNAIFAAELASRGMTGPTPVFEGKAGFFNVVSRGLFKLPQFGGGEEEFRILRSSTKRFPLGQYSQTVAQAAVEARELVGSVDEIVKVRIGTLQTGLNVMADGPDKWRPKTRETADHSIPYSAGVGLMYGRVEHGHFEPEYFENAQLLDLISRIECFSSDEANRRESEMNLCELELILRNGESRSVRVEYHRGHWRNPMSDAEMEEKFRSQAASILPARELNRLIDHLWHLDAISDVAALPGFTVQPI